MFLYFDRQGTLKEQINNDVIRAESSGVNKIYIFWEENEKLSNWEKNLDSSISYKFYGENNVVSKEYADYKKEVVQIPYNNKQDLKFFEYYKYYNFYSFVIPDDELANAEFKSCLVKIISGQSIWSLGLFAFMVDGDTKKVLPDEHITIAQWNDLLTKLGSIKGIDDYNLLLNIPIENADFTNLQPQNNTFYRCTGGESDSIKLGRIYFYNGNRYIDIVNEDIDLSNYYNKQEIDKKIEDIDIGGTSTDVQIDGVSITQDGVANLTKDNSCGLVKGCIVDNTETLTDEEKTSACEWLGALKKGTAPSRRSVVAINTTGNQTTIPVEGSYGIPITDGYALLNVPTINTFLTKATDTTYTPKKYVDDLFASGGGGSQLYLHQVPIHFTEFADAGVPEFTLILNVLSSQSTAYGSETSFETLIYDTFNKIVSLSFVSTEVRFQDAIASTFIVSNGAWTLRYMQSVMQTEYTISGPVDYEGHKLEIMTYTPTPL